MSAQEEQVPESIAQAMRRGAKLGAVTGTGTATLFFTFMLISVCMKFGVAAVGIAPIQRLTFVAFGVVLPGCIIWAALVSGALALLGAIRRQQRLGR